MSDIVVYGISGLLICLIVLTFLLSRIETDVFPENYTFKLDPFWYIISIMFLGGTAVYFAFPQLSDMVRDFTYIKVLLPFVFAVLIYGGYLLGAFWLMNLIILGGACALSFMLPADFMLFPGKLTLWQDRLIAIALIFVISKGLPLLNGLGAIASIQFCAVMISMALLSHFGGLPHILGAMALVYLGCMLAFTIFSWPPEKLVMSPGAFTAFGFIMSAFMLYGSIEFADTSMLIVASYLITEVAFALYNRYVCNNKTPELFMNTSYYRISADGQYELGVVRGVMKIICIDVVLSLIQIIAADRLALLIFAFGLNCWFLSILSGESKPEDIISLSRWGKKLIKGVFSKKKKAD